MYLYIYIYIKHTQTNIYLSVYQSCHLARYIHVYMYMYLSMCGDKRSTFLCVHAFCFSFFRKPFLKKEPPRAGSECRKPGLGFAGRAEGWALGVQGLR